MELGPALSAWLAWAGSHACPTVGAAEAFLDGLIATHGPAGAQSRFATFQIAAGYTWGPHATRHLAQVLRSRLVAEKPARLTGTAAFAAGLARLPDAWRPSFQAIIATQVVGFGDPGTVHWSKARIRSVMASLAAWYAFCEDTGRSPVPSGTGFEAWAEALTAPDRDGGPVGATTVTSYLARVHDGYGSVIAPGFRSTACRLVIDDWAAQADKEPSRRSKTARNVGASTLYSLGLQMVEEAMAAPVIGLASARTCRNGLLFAVGACLPQRARALSWLSYGQTLFLDPDFTIRIFLPAAAIKMRETKKRKRKPFERTFQNQRLWNALDTWWRIFRPLYDEGAWLFPSQLSLTEGISEDRLGAICRAETLDRLGVAVSVHDIRDNVATEASEAMENGAIRAATLLGHRDPRTTLDCYDHSVDLRVLREHARFIEERQTPGPSLLLGSDDADDENEVADGSLQSGKVKPGQRVVRFRPPPHRTPSAASAAGG